jgi:hypothetical protein
MLAGRAKPEDLAAVLVLLLQLEALEIKAVIHRQKVITVESVVILLPMPQPVVVEREELEETPLLVISAGPVVLEPHPLFQVLA